ncbi:probable protein phosphatase 2C 42 [Phragmites australis]|uniref:probable protein phosphatase 2C 42 n=1 Tax=Phragmites australis TaxID=29695 RepID=UPI002D79ED64|nr:probable protein phosphatase 2C 42 [Phragmites australis]
MALSVPVTIKTTEHGGNGRFDYAVSAMQGYRENMEDAHAIVLDLDAATATSFFGVYDGHGGPAVAKYCAKHLHIELLKFQEFHDNLPYAVERTFLRMDEMLRDRRAGWELSKYGGNEQWKKYRRNLLTSCFLPLCVQRPAYAGPVGDGCTACVALIRGNQIIVGNAGDSRCVLSRNGQAIELSTDHKPNLPAETQRIQDAGHEVAMSNRGNIHRIDDGIAISRAIGDLRYKDNANLSPQNQAVTALPEVRSEEITDDTEFLVIACDGIWDCMTSQQLVNYVTIYMNNNVDLWRICESLLSHCLAQPRGKDNMSVILVRFNKPAEGRPVHQRVAGHPGVLSSNAPAAAVAPSAPQHAAGHPGALSSSIVLPPPPNVEHTVSSAPPSVNLGGADAGPIAGGVYDQLPETQRSKSSEL